MVETPKNMKIDSRSTCLYRLSFPNVLFSETNILDDLDFYIQIQQHLNFILAMFWQGVAPLCFGNNHRSLS